MTFGQIKTLVENQLLESYQNKKDFKFLMKEFKKDVLDDKNITKLYSLYDELSTPQGVKSEDCSEFISEGISLIKELLPKVNLPKINSSRLKNNYKDIDNLVYLTNESISLSDRIESKKNIQNIISKPKPDSKKNINIPISSMLKVGNSVLENYLNKMDDDSKKELVTILEKDEKILNKEFTELKEDAISKLNKIKSQERDEELKKSITETIQRVQGESFTKFGYYKLKKLVETI